MAEQFRARKTRHGIWLPGGGRLLPRFFIHKPSKSRLGDSGWGVPRVPESMRIAPLYATFNEASTHSAACFLHASLRCSLATHEFASSSPFNERYYGQHISRGFSPDETIDRHGALFFLLFACRLQEYRHENRGLQTLHEPVLSDLVDATAE